MSPENVEVVKRIYAMTPLAFAFYAPDVEWDMSNCVGWTDAAVYRGHDGVRDFLRGWIASFDRYEPTIERLFPAGDEVVAVVNDRAYIKESSRPIERRFAHLFTFRAGMIVRVRAYSDIAEALKAAGLRSRADSAIVLLLPIAGEVELAGATNVDVETGPGCPGHAERLADVKRLKRSRVSTSTAR
ncbi:MAG TPA: nuclear transport factor 2 family protein [Solirubrobacteraceae bacterium]|jgi:ketosteroid isomerase-like protein|nr:nuclear transport factor 2 family protein [Solirubrobacteraceae bacterium]